MKIIREISKEEFKEFLFKDIALEDKNIYDEMNGDPISIFQLSADTALKFSKQIKPNSFEELDALNALSRPGSSAMLPFYIDAKENGKRMYSDPIHNILASTLGIPLYQEQIMSIFHEIGGFTLDESNELRGLMKKLGKANKDPKDLEKWNKQVERFSKNAINNGISKEESEKLTSDLVRFSSYSFNKSHSVSYTLIAVITLYLSSYFRKYFYASALAYAMTKEEGDISKTVNAIRSNGIKLSPPNINTSKEHLCVMGDQIVFGLADIKNVSEKPCPKIFECRPFTSFFDFVMKTRSRELSSSVIEALISVGAFDDFTKERVKLLLAFKKFWEEKKSIKIEEKLKAIWDKCWTEASSLIGLETTNDKLMELERKYYGTNIFVSPFDEAVSQAINKMNKLGLVYKTFDDVENIGKRTPVLLKSMRSLTDKNGNQMAFLEIEDLSGVKKSIPVFASFYQHLIGCFIVDSIYLLTLHKKEDQVMFGDGKFFKGKDNEIKVLSFVKKLK